MISGRRDAALDHLSSLPSRAGGHDKHAIAEEDRLVDVMVMKRMCGPVFLPTSGSQRCIIARVSASSAPTVVRQHQVAFEQEGAHQRHALAHAAGQLMRICCSSPARPNSGAS